MKKKCTYLHICLLSSIQVIVRIEKKSKKRKTLTKKSEKDKYVFTLLVLFLLLYLFTRGIFVPSSSFTSRWYCKIGYFCENFIFANSLKRHICYVKNSPLMSLTSSSIVYIAIFLQELLPFVGEILLLFAMCSLQLK